MSKKLNHTARKQQIIEATFEVLHSYGFEKTTIREIAKKAGLSLGSVQYFFPKQKDIYTYAMNVIFQRFEERMQKVSQDDHKAFDRAVRMVNQIVQVHSETERVENDIWVKFTLMSTMNPEYQELKENYRKINLNFAEDVINILDENGYFTEDVNIKDKAHSLIIFVTGLVFESVIYTHLYNDQLVEKRIREYLNSICH